MTILKKGGGGGGGGGGGLAKKMSLQYSIDIDK